MQLDDTVSQCIYNNEGCSVLPNQDSATQRLCLSLRADVASAVCVPLRFRDASTGKCTTFAALLALDKDDKCSSRFSSSDTRVRAPD